MLPLSVLTLVLVASLALVHHSLPPRAIAERIGKFSYAAFNLLVMWGGQKDELQPA